MTHQDQQSPDPRPRDIALEQETPEQVTELGAQSEPDPGERAGRD